MSGFGKNCDGLATFIVDKSKLHARYEERNTYYNFLNIMD